MSYGRKKPKGLSSDILKKEDKPQLDLKNAKKLIEQKLGKTKTEFLVDEDVLGVDRYLDSYGIKYRKIGDDGCPPLSSDDPTVAKFAQEHNLVVITNDGKLVKQCDLLELDYVMLDLRDLAKKVKVYNDSH